MGFPERDGSSSYWAGWDSLPQEANPYEMPSEAWQWQQGRDDKQQTMPTAIRNTDQGIS